MASDTIEAIKAKIHKKHGYLGRGGRGHFIHADGRVLPDQDTLMDLGIDKARKGRLRYLRKDVFYISVYNSVALSSRCQSRTMS